MTFNLKTSNKAFDDVIDMIRNALTANDSASDDFYDIMNHVKDFIAVAKEDIDKLEVALRSPLTSRKDLDKARELHSVVRSDLDRLLASQEMLEDRFQELLELETKLAGKERYEEIRNESFAVANRIEKEWPEIISSVRSLCNAIYLCNS